MRRAGLLHDGDQLRLSLDWRGQPWDGQSPRALTRRSNVVIFEARAEGAHEVFADPEQLELWPIEGPIPRKGPRREAPGAPLLDELKLLRRLHHGETR